MCPRAPIFRIFSGRPQYDYQTANQCSFATRDLTAARTAVFELPLIEICQANAMLRKRRSLLRAGRGASARYFENGLNMRVPKKELAQLNFARQSMEQYFNQRGSS
jgi:hypothetical protein